MIPVWKNSIYVLNWILLWMFAVGCHTWRWLYLWRWQWCSSLGAGGKTWSWCTTRLEIWDNLHYWVKRFLVACSLWPHEDSAQEISVCCPYTQGPEFFATASFGDQRFSVPDIYCSVPLQPQGTRREWHSQSFGLTFPARRKHFEGEALHRVLLWVQASASCLWYRWWCHATNKTVCWYRSCGHHQRIFCWARYVLLLFTMLVNMWESSICVCRVWYKVDEGVFLLYSMHSSLCIVWGVLCWRFSRNQHKGFSSLIEWLFLGYGCSNCRWIPHRTCTKCNKCSSTRT